MEHGDTFTSYCHTCQKNICICCENNHSNNHYTISFGKIFPKKEDLTNKLNVLKNNIDKFKIEIKKIKDILDYTLENIEHYYKIISNIYNNFNIKKRNYTILTNINGINNDSILTDIQDIIKEENIGNKFDKI